MPPRRHPQSLNSQNVLPAADPFKRRHNLLNTALIPHMVMTGVASNVSASSARKKPWKHTRNHLFAKEWPARIRKFRLLSLCNRVNFPFLPFAEATAIGKSHKQTASTCCRNWCHAVILGVRYSDMAIVYQRLLAGIDIRLGLVGWDKRRTARTCPCPKTIHPATPAKPWLLTARWWAWRAERASSSR